ncbi:MAG TPA: virulence factor [Gammaproteobacteria bacterium]
MAKLITVYWRDIPSQVIAKRGRDTAKVPLTERFQVAIDRAAMRAGKGSSELYIDEWRREARACSNELETEAKAEAEKLEAAFDDGLLERMIKAGGKKVEATES